MYVKGMGTEAIEHDVTPAAGYEDQTGDKVIMGDDFYDGQTTEYAGLKSKLLSLHVQFPC